jgi:cytidylate kinase
MRIPWTFLTQRSGRNLKNFVWRKTSFVIAIDGPAGAGKSTLARGLARALGFTYVDTGAMYRAVAWKALERGVPLDSPVALARLAAQMDIVFKPKKGGQEIIVDGVAVGATLRTPEVTQVASVVATVPGVRRALVQRQRDLGRGGRVVMEGRDIGTVVFPRANIKFFLEASPQERARRRYEEIKKKGEEIPLAVLAAAIRRRDNKDRSRTKSPLRPAKDAIRIDSTGLSPRQSLAHILILVKQKISFSLSPCGRGAPKGR